MNAAIEGRTGNTLAPRETLTRAEAAVIIARCLATDDLIERFAVMQDDAQIVNGQVVHDRIIQQTASIGHNLGAERQLTQIDRITIHHCWTSNPETQTLADVNVTWTSQGWPRPGYHFVIRPNGDIWQLTPIHAISWGAGNPNNMHNPPPNTRSIHIAFAGRFAPSVSLPTQAARDSFGFLCRLLLSNSQLPNIYDVNEHVMGHRLWRNGDSNDCPGILRVNYLSWI